jgi:hypothetical protein
MNTTADRQRCPARADGASLRAAALDVVAAALGLLRELAPEEVEQVVEAARAEVERRRAG